MQSRDKRSRERRKRLKRKYGQGKFKHAKRGVISCIMSGIAFVLAVSVLLIAYQFGGHAAMYIGGMGMISLILSGVGLYMGIRGYKERNKIYRTCTIGVTLNSVTLLVMFLIFCRGLFH